MKHEGENAHRADYEVVRLGRADFKAAQDFVRARHYSKSVANTAIAIHALLKAGHLVGVAWWMPPASPRAARYVARLYGDEAAHGQVLALSRLVVAESEPRNAESILLGAAIADIKRDPRWSYLVTFADEGQVDPRTGKRHTGTIYKATGWAAAGYSAATDRWEDALGRHVALKATTTRTVAEMDRLGYSRTGRSRKARFTMALRTKSRRNPTPELQAQIDAEVAAGLYDDPLKGDPTWERFCEVEERLVSMRPGSKGYADLAREYTDLRAKLKASRPARGPRRNPTAPLKIGQRVKHPTYGPGTVVAAYSGPFGPSWAVDFDNGTELAVRARDVVPLLEHKRNPGFRYALTPPTPPPLAQEHRAARARLLGKIRRNGPAATKLQGLIKADESLAERLLAIADPQYVGQVVDSPASIAAVVRPFVAGYDQEVLAVIAVDRRHAVVGGAVLTKGNDSFTIVDPKMIYRWALTQGRSGATAIVMVHNHPSGNHRPSQADIDVTQRVAQAGRALGINLLDHIVMTDSGLYTSLAEQGQVPYYGGTLTMTGG